MWAISASTLADRHRPLMTLCTVAALIPSRRAMSICRVFFMSRLPLISLGFMLILSPLFFRFFY
jgi:hypothetical protein